jgi:hypothetical protein
MESAHQSSGQSLPTGDHLLRYVKIILRRALRSARGAEEQCWGWAAKDSSVMPRASLDIEVACREIAAQIRAAALEGWACPLPLQRETDRWPSAERTCRA